MKIFSLQNQNMCYNTKAVVKTVFGGVAQLGERTVRIRKVKGSNPSVSTTGPRTKVLGPFAFAKVLVFLGFSAFFGVLKHLKI